MFLYQVTDNEGNYAYLFGTCHPGRDEIKSLDNITEKVLKESDSIYIECTFDTQKANKYKHCQWNDLKQVKIQLYFQTVSAG